MSDILPPLPSRRTATNYGDALQQYKESVAEEIAGLRDALATAEALYARLDATEVEHDPFPSSRPRVDARLFTSAGTDECEQWKPVEDVPGMVDVATGGHL